MTSMCDGGRKEFLNFYFFLDHNLIRIIFLIFFFNWKKMIQQHEKKELIQRLKKKDE